MISTLTKNGNTESEAMIAELRQIAERKRRTVEHIERAIAAWYKRHGLTDSIPRFNREEVGQG